MTKNSSQPQKRNAPKTQSQTKTPQECKNKRQALSQTKRLLDQNQVSFRTDNQKILYEAIDKHDITIVSGPAGSGKTYITVYKALEILTNKENNIDGIIIVKPLVEAANEKLGFLPGGIEEKTDPFMLSYWQSFEKIITKERLKILLDGEVIKVVPLAYMRGVTFEDKVVILDEAQNAYPSQIKMFLSRIGMGSKYIISGDIEQSDRNEKGNGLEDTLDRFYDMNEIAQVKFFHEDIVRHKLIAKILERY